MASARRQRLLRNRLETLQQSLNVAHNIVAADAEDVSMHGGSTSGGAAGGGATGIDGVGPDSALPSNGDVDAMMESAYNDVIRAAVTEARVTAHAEYEAAIDALHDADLDTAAHDLRAVRLAWDWVVTGVGPVCVCAGRGGAGLRRGGAAAGLLWGRSYGCINDRY